ncbi:MAG: Ig-like domain repeat protein [Chloroflexi bacterium]|nr:Ig-like domain repeat protein [Chloroflexota bacterium]
MRTRLFILVIVAALLAVVGSVGLALADDGGSFNTKLSLAVPSSTPLGQSVRLEARLQDGSGNPIKQGTIVFYISTGFLSGTSGLMPIGSAATNDLGVAVLEHEPRQNGQIEVVARFLGDARHGPSQDVAKISIVGNHQLYEAEAGIHVPFVGKWILVLVLGFIWGTYLFVVSRVLKIATAPPEK